MGVIEAEVRVPLPDPLPGPIAAQLTVAEHRSPVGLVVVVRCRKTSRRGLDRPLKHVLVPFLVEFAIISLVAVVVHDGVDGDEIGEVVEVVEGFEMVGVEVECERTEMIGFGVITGTS